MKAIGDWDDLNQQFRETEREIRGAIEMFGLGSPYVAQLITDIGNILSRMFALVYARAAG